jgi:SnoaL-like domain
MKAEEVTRRYHDAWNKRDADALVGAFIEGGTYRSPDTPPQGVSGEDFAAFLKGVWTAFPDLSVEVIEAGEIRRGIEVSAVLVKPHQVFGRAITIQGEHYRPNMRDDLENSIRSERMFKASFFAGPLSSRLFSSPSSRAASTGL